MLITEIYIFITVVKNVSFIQSTIWNLCRVTGLIRSGVMTEVDVPLWYSVYRKFPPKYEPYYSRPPLDVDVKDIYYPEDKLRA